MPAKTHSLSLTLHNGNGNLENPKISLMKLIHETGTLMEASRVMGISYKTACNWVEMINNAGNTPLIKSAHGGAEKGKTSLTEAGLRSLKKYERLQSIYSRFQEELDEDAYTFIKKLSLLTSARNQLYGNITEIIADNVQAKVKIQITAKMKIVAQISADSLQNMALQINDKIAAVFKASAGELTADEGVKPVRSENSWACKLHNVIANNDNADISVKTADGKILHVILKKDCWEALSSKSQKLIFHIKPSYITLIGLHV